MEGERGSALQCQHLRLDTHNKTEISFTSEDVKHTKKGIRFLLLPSCERRCWWAREYLMTTTGLSMQYQLKDKSYSLCVSVKRSSLGLHSIVLGLPLLRVPYQ